jgi:hypothetical protein
MIKSVLPVLISALAVQRHTIGAVCPLASIILIPCDWQVVNWGIMAIARAKRINAIPRIFFMMLLLLPENLCEPFVALDKTEMDTQ